MAYKAKPRWTWAQKRFLAENYDALKDHEIARSLGKTVKSVRRMRDRLELTKLPGRGVCEPRPRNEEDD